MSKARRHTLGLIFATATVALSYLVGSSVTPAKAAGVDPVDNPTYWTTIWDHVGALNPSATLNPETDWQSLVTSWGQDGYLASAPEAAAAKAAIDAEAADTLAMEAAGSIPTLDGTAGLLAATLSPEVVLPLAAGVGISVLIGTGAGQRVVDFVLGGLFGGTGSANYSNQQLTGNVKWFYTNPATDYVGATISPGWEGDYELLNTSTGSLSYSGTTPDCGAKSGTCSSGLMDAKYAVVNSFPDTMHQLAQQQAAGLSTTCNSTSSCTIRGWSKKAPVAVNGIEANTAPHSRANTSGGAQADPGTSSQKATNVRNAIKANPTLHAQYDCKLQPADYTCPALVPTPSTSPVPVTLPWIPIYLPAVFPGETLESYAERLRSKQWVGAISDISDPMGYPAGSPATQLAPGTITSVSITTATGVVTIPIYDPVTGQPDAWPTNPPKIETNTSPVTIERVPDGYTPAAGGIHMPTISFACQFPFGFICWAQDVTGWFNVSPQAPDFNFTIPDQTVGGHTYHVGSHYDVNLNVMDSYMTTFRSILSVVLWVGGIYWLAVKLLGFHPGGDPGEAIDEGLDFDGL